MKILDLKLLKNKRILILIGSITILIILLAGFILTSDISDVTTYIVHRDEFIIDIPVRGEIGAASQTTISVPDRVYGNVRITKLVEDGSRVEAGAFLVQFDTSEAEERVTNRLNDLENARASLASTMARIESNMKQLESSYQTQKFTYEQAKLRYEMMKYEAEAKRREEELNFKKSEIALERASEKIESQKIIDRADISKAEVRVKQAEMRYNEAVEQLNALTIKSPKAGLVVLEEIYDWSTQTRDKLKVGDQPRRGMVIMSIPDLSVMLAKMQVNEVDINRVILGQEVVVIINAIPGQTNYGIITNVASLARRDEGSEVKVFDVECIIDDNNENLKPGMTAQCTIITDRIPGQLYIPLDCVFGKGDTTVVYVKERGFKQRPVKLGQMNSDYIVVKEGLSEGEEIALRDPTIPLDELGKEEPVTSAGISSQNNNATY